MDISPYEAMAASGSCYDPWWTVKTMNSRLGTRDMDLRPYEAVAASGSYYVLGWKVMTINS